MVYQQNNQPVFDWEGFTVPLLRLEQWLKFPRASRAFDTDEVPIIDQATVFLVAQGDALVGIQVDRYWGEQEVSIRQVEGALKLPAGFAGCTILGDSRIAPLIDTSELLLWIEQRRQQEAETQDTDQTLSISQTPVSQEQLVMVVDDSVNVRRFLALTLEKAGYRVEQAKDGQHALEKVQMGLPIQAVICDIEMPRLDGYGFLANVKAIPSAQDIPVVMLTSRSGDKHRKLAMSLGASDYFSKPFREQALLEALSQLISKTA
jgi:two-component system, chemotaxis family, sensor histidine kinase and response regulator PixL